MTQYIGQEFGNYRLISLLRQGSSADVYLGEHVYLKTQAAIKVLQMRLSSDNLDGFLNEARTIARLEHPHVVRVLDFGVQDTIPFLVMLYAPNGTLRQRHPKGSTVSPASIMSYVKQIAEALQYAHDKKIIHRDIKPENLLLGRKDEVLLGDFGLALVAQSSSYQSTQMFAGTVTYMAPEHIQGRPCPASDQYALGIVVYEWLSGDCPFHGSFTELCTQHMFAPPPLLWERVPGLAPALEAVVMKALAKDSQQRFESVHAFATAWEEAVLSGPVSTFISPLPVNRPADATISAAPVVAPALTSSGNSMSTPAPDPVRSPAPPLVSRPIAAIQPASQSHRHLSRRTVIVSMGLAGLAAAGISWWRLSQPPAVIQLPASSQSRPGLSIGQLLYTYYGHSATVNAVAWSDDGMFIASGSTDATVQVWNAATGHTLLVFHGHGVTVRAVAWSPDGKWIASGSQDHIVLVWNSITGKLTIIYSGHAAAVNAVAWSPDGKWIASGSQDQSVLVWNASTGKLAVTYRGHSSAVNGVAWSPDSTRIVSASSDTTAQVWDASTGRLAVTYRGHSRPVGAVAWSPDGKRIASGSGDETAQVWDASTGRLAVTYRGHSRPVDAVAWSPDSARIASASGDTTVQIWNSATGSHVYTYHGHFAYVDAVAWSPDGQYIASGAYDSSVQVWRAT
jgi:eukaryotic-like serine/threonine-protein kinase